MKSPLCRLKWEHYLAILLPATAGLAGASGFDVPDQDAFAVARGTAVTATPDNPSTIFYNPAGLTQLPGHNFRLGVYGISLEPTYRNPTTGETFGNRDKLHALPHFFYSYGTDWHGLSFGLGVYMPSALGAHWPDGTGFRTLTTKSLLQQVAITPTVAVKLLDSLSLGAGLAVNYASIDLRQGILWPKDAFDQLRFQGEGWNVSGNFGLLWQPLEQLSLGATVDTGTRITVRGNTTAYNNVAFPPGYPFYPPFSTHSDAHANLPLPLKAKGGISYRPTPHWNVEFDAEYVDWQALGTITIHQQSGLPGLLPQDLSTVYDWDASWYYTLGATRSFDNGWRVSAGYIFNENSVPKAHYLPAVADENRHFFSAGVGRKGKQFDFDVAYQFGWGPERTITGSDASAAGQTADGDYRFLSHAVAVSLGWHF